MICNLFTNKTVMTALLVAYSMLMPMTSQASGPVTAAEIAAAVSDHTYQGSMAKDSFAEYYHADGSIKAKGYSGKWRVMDNVMCFKYGDAAERCWDVGIDGPAMTMYKKGNVAGNGMLVKGNPNNF